MKPKAELLRIAGRKKEPDSFVDVRFFLFSFVYTILLDEKEYLS